MTTNDIKHKLKDLLYDIISMDDDDSDENLDKIIVMASNNINKDNPSEEEMIDSLLTAMSHQYEDHQYDVVSPSTIMVSDPYDYNEILNAIYYSTDSEAFEIANAFDEIGLHREASSIKKQVQENNRSVYDEKARVYRIEKDEDEEDVNNDCDIKDVKHDDVEYHTDAVNKSKFGPKRQRSDMLVRR